MSDDPQIPPPPPPSGSPPPPPPAFTPPPGYVGYSSSPTVSGAVKRIGGLSKAVMILAGLVALASVIQTAVSSGLSSDAQAFLDGELSESEFEDRFVAIGAFGTLSSLLGLAAAIVTIIWMFRIASNVRAYARRTTWHPLFSIFGWFLPPFLYIIPFLVLREQWKASEPSAVDGTDAWKQTRDNPLLWAWLVLYGIVPAVLVVASIGTLAGSNFGGGALEAQAETLADFGALQWFAALMSVAAAAVWIPFVRQLTARHRQLTNEV